jgi:hypothetical protein
MGEGNLTGPTAKTTWTCDGCPLLRTEDWEFHEENDGVDRGTDATCDGAEGREIATYWHKGYPTPAWCPYPLTKGPSNG